MDIRIVDEFVIEFFNMRSIYSIHPEQIFIFVDKS